MPARIPRRIDSNDFHWLVGILEGEGTFGVAPPSAPGIPFVRVCMTDRDVVDRVAGLWGRAMITLPPKRDGHKVAYATAIKGSPSVVLMDLARPHMGRRRREQIDRAVASCHGISTGRTRPSALDGFAHPTCDATCALPWLVGLLEGEGCFTINWNAGRGYPVIYVTMCDHDVVDRAGAMLGATNVRFDPSRQQRWQPTYVAQIGGYKAAAWMRTLAPHMGLRRQAAIEAALAAYRPVRLSVAPEHCVVPGCLKPHRGRGLCHRHYMSWSRDVAKGRPPRVAALR